MNSSPLRMIMPVLGYWETIVKNNFLYTLILTKIFYMTPWLVVALGHGWLIIISNNHYHLNKPSHSISAHLIRSLQSNEIIIRRFKQLNSDIFHSLISLVGPKWHFPVNTGISGNFLCILEFSPIISFAD